MRKSSLLFVLLFALTVPGHLNAQSTMPQMQTVAPASGRTGDVLTVTGENLGAEMVAALYLTDGKEDVRVQIVEQAATAIKFKIPSSAKTGRFALMVLTHGKDPKLIEEPVKVVVEAPLVGPTG